MTGSGLIVEGLVSLENRGFTGARVYAYLPESFTGGGEPVPAGTAESGVNGRFSMELPEGKYILLARAPGKFAWFGRNPLKVSAHQRGLSLPLVAAEGVTTAAVAEGEENIRGRVLLGGKPAAGVRVSAHLRADAGFRGQPYASSALTASDGEYKLALDPGVYFITARKRATGLEVGPLTPGDLFGVLPELPLKVGRGKEQKSDIELVELPSYEQQARYRTRFAKLEGTIRTGEGNPAEGFRACLYDNPRMLGEPLAISAPTGPDGRFTISVSVVGRYYLGAREHLGGPPVSGERVGFARDAPEGYEIAPGKVFESLEVILVVAP
ncbi:hypothetical protein EPN96_07705 [bacterium]|nr:MAG: hypothetical protein EPN96_07705 [bacterium]